MRCKFCLRPLYTNEFPLDANATFYTFAEMLESNNLVTFEGLANSSAYHTFLLDEERGRLVVGAKDHIFSFNLLNVSRDYAKVTRRRDAGRFFRSLHPSILSDCESVLRF